MGWLDRILLAIHRQPPTTPRYARIEHGLLLSTTLAVLVPMFISAALGW